MNQMLMPYHYYAVFFSHSDSICALGRLFGRSVAHMQFIIRQTDIVFFLDRIYCTETNGQTVVSFKIVAVAACMANAFEGSIAFIFSSIGRYLFYLGPFFAAAPMNALFHVDLLI